MSNTTIMVFNPKRDYSLLLVTYNNGDQGHIISPSLHHHKMNMQRLDGDEPLQARSIVVIPGDSFDFNRVC